MDDDIAFNHFIFTCSNSSVRISQDHTKNNSTFIWVKNLWFIFNWKYVRDCISSYFCRLHIVATLGKEISCWPVPCTRKDSHTRSGVHDRQTLVEMRSNKLTEINLDRASAATVDDTITMARSCWSCRWHTSMYRESVTRQVPSQKQTCEPSRFQSGRFSDLYDRSLINVDPAEISRPNMNRWQEQGNSHARSKPTGVDIWQSTISALRHRWLHVV